MKRQRLRTTLLQTKRTLEGLRGAGITHLPQPSRPISAPHRRKDSKAASLEWVRKKAASCTLCKLCKGRTHVVFGEGNLEAKILFVGEGPGQEEDRLGRPFVGAAGKLLTQMLEEVGLKREHVYIANIVKCRPPNNRPPEPDEIEACRPYLEAQLSTIAPRVICAMGRTAASALLETQAPLGQLRGKVFRWRDMPVLVTFHPAYLLRNPSAKSTVVEDFKKLLSIGSQDG